MSVEVIETKECVLCRRSLPVTDFKLRSSRGRQAGSRQTKCNRCLWVSYGRPSAERKTDRVRQYKLAFGCADCGYAAHPAALEFDHRPGEVKLFNVGESCGNYNLEKLFAEIAKCDVVCANCHAIRTDKRRVPVGIQEVA